MKAYAVVQEMEVGRLVPGLLFVNIFAKVEDAQEYADWMNGIMDASSYKVIETSVK